MLLNSAGIDLAGGVEDSPAVDLDGPIFDRTLGVNLRGTIVMAKYTMPLLRREGRSIISSASVSRVVLGSSQYAYAASKGGILRLTSALALGYAPDRVRANVIVPRIIRISMIDLVSRQRGAGPPRC